MDSKRIIAMERWNLLFAAILIAASALLFSQTTTLGVAIGAAVSCLNFWGIRKLITLSFRSRGKKRAVLQLVLMLKMGLLMGVFWLATKLLPITPMTLAIGFSVFLPSILAETIRFSFSQADAEHEDNAEASING